MYIMLSHKRDILAKGLCKEFFFQKSEITMEVGGWGPGLTRNFFLLEHRPKIAVNQC